MRPQKSSVGGDEKLIINFCGLIRALIHGIKVFTLIYYGVLGFFYGTNVLEDLQRFIQLCIYEIYGLSLASCQLLHDLDGTLTKNH